MERCKASVILPVSLARVRIQQKVFFKDVSTLNFFGLYFSCLLLMFFVLFVVFFVVVV